MDSPEYHLTAHRNDMSKWGVFEDERGNWRSHVAPCDDTGSILGPHVRSPSCPCVPHEDNEAEELWIHHDLQRGGCNS